MRRRVSAEKKVSTAFSQELEVGVKWNTQRGGGRARRGPWGACDGVVVEDRMDDLAGRYRTLDGAQEADELLMSVALHAAPRTTPSSTLSAANRVVVP